LGDCPQTVPKLPIQEYLQPRLQIWQQFGSDPNTDWKRLFETVAQHYLSNIYTLALIDIYVDVEMEIATTDLF
jgi:hypothetical protein